VSVVDEGWRPAASDDALSVARARKLLILEVVVVLAASFGRSALYAMISLADSLTTPKTLNQQQQTLNGALSPRPWFDLAYNLFDIASGLVPVLLVAYLLLRENVSLRVLGLDASDKARDLGRAALIAAGIGGSGLCLYLAAHAMNLAVTVVPTSLPDVWWRVPVLVLSAFQNGIAEEVVVLGYLLRRFDQLGWAPWRSDLTSSLIRGSYHLYQGFGGFLGNLVMGLIFARLYRRWGRVTPMLIAHGLIDTVTFVGYIYLVGKVSWLPH
jgi:membrane protease YdiL (CAAX protease family)